MLAFEGLYNAHLYAFLTRTNFEPRRVTIIQIFSDIFNLRRKETLKFRLSTIYIVMSIRIIENS